MARDPGIFTENGKTYYAPFVPTAAALFLGAIFWLRIDASQELEAPRL